MTTPSDPAGSPGPSDPLDPTASLPRIPSDLSARLRRQHGDEVDPEVTLVDEDASPTPSSSTPSSSRSGPPSWSSPASGRAKERYTFEGEIARGGMGAVLGVYDQDLRRRLAMKVILTAEDGSVADSTLGRFLEEAQVTAQLDHPGVVPVHEMGLDEQGQVYFTMKLVKGDDLRAVFEKVRNGADGWTVPRALNLLLRVCEALAFAHSKGVIHRDLKPANIMVGRFGEVYVMDWGIARVLGQADRKDLRLQTQPAQTEVIRSDRREVPGDDGTDAPLLTMDGDVVGTPAFMPLEQAEGRLEDIDARSDVYSLGAILYELLAGQMPYVPPGARLSARAVHYAVLQGPPTPLEELAPTSPPELLAICNKAMARRPQDRYPSTEELAEDLRAFLEQRVVRAYRTGIVVELRKWVQRNKGLAASLVAGLLLLLGLGGTGVVAAATKEKNAQLAIAVDERDEANARLASKNQELDGLNAALNESNGKLNTANAALATSNQKLEVANEGLVATVEERDRANADLDDRNRLLGDLEILRELQERERALWPARPRLRGAMDDWIATAGGLLIRLPDHEQDLEALRQAAAPITDEVLEAALARSPRRRDFDDAAAVLAEMETLPDQDPETRTERESLRALRTEIEEAARATVQWRFPGDPEAKWRHDNLTALVQGARALAAPDTGLMASMETRRERAASIEDATIGKHYDEWLEAIDAVASSEHYDGLELSEQVGLVPIGTDPDSGLWEFWHFESGERPERDPETGRIVVTEDMGLVLVLIPGGTFWMGASADPASPNHDSWARDGQGPVHKVTLAPYLLSKHELTQGQWFRLTAERLSEYTAGNVWGGNTILDSNPVTNVSWEDGQRVLQRFGLRLPTEAQWERACRAGSPSPWWCGSRADLAAPEGIAGNILDQGAMDRGAPASWGIPEPWDDGHAVHAPIGSFRANRLGLHDVLGNVWEWCEDEYVQTAYQLPVDGEDGHRRLLGRLADGLGSRVQRGGSYFSDATDSRSAYRSYSSPTAGNINTGLRPAQRLTKH